MPEGQMRGGAGRDVIIGTATGANRIFGGTGNDQIAAGSFRSTVYGGSGTDYVVGGGFQSELWGGGPDSATGSSLADTEADIFGLANGAMAMDVGTNDFVLWDGFRLTGGVQQWWQEGQWAYWAPFSSLLSGAPSSFLNLFGALSTILDVPAMTSFRYALTDDGNGGNQLVVQAGRGMAGQAVINDYSFNLDTGVATGNIAVLAQQLVEHATIADLSRYLNLVLKAGFGVCFTGTDPLVLDLDGDGLELVRRDASGTYFDIDGDGFAEKTGWVSGGDGFLARDLNGNGRIDDITELFGNATTQGFAALGPLDANADGAITAADAGFATLRVWRDLNQNGTTDAGELQTLAQAGITQISLASTTPAITEINGNTIRASASDRKRRRTGRGGRPDHRGRRPATVSARPNEGRVWTLRRHRKTTRQVIVAERYQYPR